MIAWQCPKCGNAAQLSRIAPVTCRCGHVDNPEEPQTPIPPNVLQKGVNFIKAWSRWNFAGRPARSDEEIKSIRSICASCPGGYFDGQICLHKKCGCSVSEPGVFGDKIAMATEHCPIGEW